MRVESQLARVEIFCAWNKTFCKCDIDKIQGYKARCTFKWFSMGRVGVREIACSLRRNWASGTEWHIPRFQLQQESKSSFDRKAVEKSKKGTLCLNSCCLLICLICFQVKIIPVTPPRAPYMKDNTCNNAVSEVCQPVFLRAAQHQLEVITRIKSLPI